MTVRGRRSVRGSNRAVSRAGIRTSLVVISLILAPAGASGQEVSGEEADRRVEFLLDTIVEKDGRLVRLLGGSTWRLTYAPFVLSLSDVAVVLTSGHSRGTLFFESGQEIAGAHLSGKLSGLNSGTLTSVVDEFGDGAILKTADGALWEVPSYDQYDTGWWLPPYRVIITNDELFMVNLEKLKKVWVTRVD